MVYLPTCFPHQPNVGTYTSLMDPYRDMIILVNTRGTLGSAVPWCRPQGLVAKRRAQVGMIGDAWRVSTLDYMTDGYLDLVFSGDF